MLSIKISEGYVPILGLAYPLEITNDGLPSENIALSAANTLFTSNNLQIGGGETVTVYACTSVASDVITATGSNTVDLVVTMQVASEVNEFGSESYISIFELPGEDNIIPTLDNIHLLMRQGHYFKAPGEVKIWRPDIV